MSIIEQAAKRLEELRRAGITVAPVRGEPPPPSVPEQIAQREAVAELQRPPGPPPAQDLPSLAKVDPVPAARNDTPFAPRRESKSVQLDLARLAHQGYITPDAARSQLADEYRVIKRPLLTNAMGKGASTIERGNLVMITSALPGEGKTFTALNLALSMAMELDCTVLLVDADVARPAVLSRLGLPKMKGLLDLLTEPGLQVSDVLLRTNVERLSILPAGTQHPRATELLASDGMEALLQDLSSRYSDRVLIFDAPPLLPSTESRVLAAHMGQVVVVVEAQRTQQSTVLSALSFLENCPVVMTLLNKDGGSDGASYYGYYGNAPT